MEHLKISIYDAGDIYEQLGFAERLEITKNREDRIFKLKTNPRLRKMHKFKPYPNEENEYEFYLFDSYRNFKEAAVVLFILHQKDHMTRIMTNKGKYEVWSRAMWW